MGKGVPIRRTPELTESWKEIYSRAAVQCTMYNGQCTMYSVRTVFIQHKKFSDALASLALTEMENVKSFTRTNINKPDFTPEKSA